MMGGRMLFGGIGMIVSVVLVVLVVAVLVKYLMN